MLLLRVASLLASLLLASSLAAQPSLELLTDAVSLPMHVTHAGDDRLFIVERGGAVRVFEGGALRAEPYLEVPTGASAEQDDGLFSIAFHPHYEENGFSFVFFAEAGDPGPTIVVSRFTVADGDPNAVDPTSRRDLLRIAVPSPTHVGGQVQFGPDGYLYVSTGDGGTDDVNCLAQDPGLLLGKLLRLDVDASVDSAPWYGVPATNPFVGESDPLDLTADEIWSIGLRNPFRFSFDRSAGALWLGDVGRDTSEEVDVQLATSGGGENYGWNVMEGTACVLPDPTDAGCPPSTPPCGDSAYTPPIFEVDHPEVGLISITGGVVYRGTESPAYQGRYIFGDTFQGGLWALDAAGSAPESELLIPLGSVAAVGIGEDRDGELLVADLFANRVYRLQLGSAPVVPDEDCALRSQAAVSKLARQAEAELRRCAIRKARGRPGVDVAACLDSDPRGRIARGVEKLEATEARFCTPPRSFGFAGTTTAAEAAREGAEGLIVALFGVEPDEALASAGPATREAHRCQQRLLRASQACQKARRSGFLGCLKAGLREGEIASLAELSGCLDADPKGRVERVCGERVQRSIGRSCSGVDLAESFPGCGGGTTSELLACVETATRCRHCRRTDAAAALGVNCDLVDDGVANRSCLPAD